MHVCSYVRTSSMGWPTNGSISTCARFVNRQEFIGDNAVDFCGFLHVGCSPLNKSRCFNIPLSRSCHMSTVRSPSKNTKTTTFSSGFMFLSFSPFSFSFHFFFQMKSFGMNSDAARNELTFYWPIMRLQLLIFKILS